MGCGLLIVHHGSVRFRRISQTLNRKFSRKACVVAALSLLSLHLVVTSIYTLAAATRSEARASLACPASQPSDFLLQKFPSGNP